jgi:hypothetical protein
VDARLTFEMNGQGKVTDLVLHRNGRDQTAKRSQTGPSPTKEHKEAAINPKILDNYVVGSYELAPNFILAVTREEITCLRRRPDRGRWKCFRKAITTSSGG